MANTYKTICLIAAAGSGTRVGNKSPKQYLPLNGTPMLRHTVLAFLTHPEVDAVRVIYSSENKDLYEQAVGDLDLLPPIEGGALRQESIRQGLCSIEEYQPENVLIHDAARPLISHAVISRVIAAIQEHKAVIPALPVEDTIKKCADGQIIHTINREDLMRAQTPQGFAFKDILTAHEKVAGQEFTDDAAIHEHLNLPVRIVEGSQINFKITTEEDFDRAERLMKAQNTTETRVGTGFDVHAFCDPKQEKGNHIMLCGVAVPSNKSLKGHSDSDVGLHALVDAILGAISQGDIGQHFPPSDDAYKDMDSSVFLEKANELLKQSGATINNIDVTLICEEPKVGPHRDNMRQRIANILNIEVTRVSIKATTTEGLGFTGRREGIAAQAVASVNITGK